MTPFQGFPPGPTRYTPVPDLFFVELLGQIDDLDEMKLTLYMIWSLYRQKGYPRYLTVPELSAEGLLLSALASGTDADPQPRLCAAINRAVERGTLLRLSIGDEGDSVDYLFLNTPQGRRAVREVSRGDLQLERTGPIREPHVERARPQILELYEQNIGLLQPLLVEELLEAEDEYPATWVREAFQIAAQNNVRRWNYVKGILRRWATEGKGSGPKSGPQQRRQPG